MRLLPSLCTGLILCCGLGAAGAIAADGDREERREERQEDRELDALRAEVEQLRSIMPGQAFAMTQVAYNANNLYFAVQAENWPLATFYLNETRVRLRWAMRVTPVRKISSGDLELTPIATAVENVQMAALDTILANQNKTAFTSAYQDLLNACEGCHVASEKAFLQLTIPAMPAESLIQFQP
jgi:hypothetical protein